MAKNSKDWFDIFPECPDDIAGIRKVNLAAFKGPAEADLIDQLRQTSPNFVSLVAKANDQVIGHILFTPVRIEASGANCIQGMGLGPLAVLPEFQRRGIGSALCKMGLKTIKRADVPFVVVLGHPSYYPRFGFTPASAHGITCVYQDIPNDAFMIRIFNPEAMIGLQGVAYYRQEFDQVS